MTEKRKRPNFTSDVLDDITELAAADPRPSAEAMRRSLDVKFPGTAEKPVAVPSARWIRDFVAGLNVPDPDAHWTLVAAQRDSSPYVLPVLAAVTSATNGNVRQLTNAQATLIARIRRGASELPLIDAYRVAKLYLTRQARDAPTDDLDQVLSWAPWRNAAAKKRYDKAVKAGWFEEVTPGFVDLAGTALIRVVATAELSVRRGRTKKGAKA